MLTRNPLSAALLCSLTILAGCSGDDGTSGANGTSEVLLDLALLGRYSAGTQAFDAGAAEIVAFDAATDRLFVINAADVTVDVLSMSNPATPTLIGTIDATAEGAVANSVAVRNGIVAVAIEAGVKTDPGSVVFYNAGTLAKLGEAAVGAQPDMLTFTPDGNAVLVANEGEPDAGYANDPVGSISVIDVSSGFSAPTVATAGFGAFDVARASLIGAGVRIYGPDSGDDVDTDVATVSQDLEPEYIAVAADGTDTAFVTLQEANAFAVLDFSNPSAPQITEILPLGYKDHMWLGNELDPSDRDPQGSPNILLRNWPVFGMYQPDGVASYAFNGRTYYVTANEGDDRNDFIAGGETARISTLALDPTAFPNAASLQATSALGRLAATRFTGDLGADGDYDELYVLGGRSFSIWTDDGRQVYDSGADFERITARQYPLFFNVDHSSNALEDRSDNKGPEPEGVALGQIAGRTFAFIGLERIGGVMVYDVTNPQNPRFIQYASSRDFTKVPTTDHPNAGDLGPEGLTFVSAADSPSGQPLLLVGNEVSGTVAVFGIDVIELEAP